MLADPGGVNDLTRAIIGCGIRVHDFLGPGLFESVYRECMLHELNARGFAIEVERPISLVYRDLSLKSKFYVDVVVERTVVLELKAVVSLEEIHKRQLLTYLRLSGLPIGLLLNFNVVTLTNGGVKRCVNPASARNVDGWRDAPRSPPEGLKAAE
jgi:GxxExxY protein